MEILSLVAIGVSVMLALNVGGNNSAAEMGPAFGSGIRSRLEAVILIAVFSMLGAIFAGDHVVHTVGTGLMDASHLRAHTGAVIVILLSATALIALANVLHVPVATAHAMVGAVVGMGLYFGSVQWANLFRIMAWWLVTPVASLVISYFLGHRLYPWLAPRLAHADRAPVAHRVYRGFVTVAGCYMAFSAGSNSLAKAVSPLVGAGILSITQAAVLGGLCMAAGAAIVGHRLMHTLGKGITPLDPLKATMVEVVCGTILLIASYAGVPVSLAEIVTCSVIGFGLAHAGLKDTLRNKYVRTIYKLWPVTPLATLALSFGGGYVLAWLR